MGQAQAPLLRLVILVTLASGTLFEGRADEIRLASDGEFVALLQGCWTSGADTPMRRASLCFSEDGTLATTSHLANDEGGFDGFSYESSGKFEVVGSKLNFQGPTDYGWVFWRPTVSCDAIVEPKQMLKVINCIGTGPDHLGVDEGPEAMYDATYAWSAND